MSKPASDRTEKATPERLKKARQEGQLVSSQEVPSAMILASILLALIFVLPGFINWSRETLTKCIRATTNGIGDGQQIGHYLWDATASLLVTVSPIFIITAVVSIASSVIVSGLVYSPKAIKLDLGKISPIKGIKNIISMKALVRLLMSLAKLTLIGTICYFYLMGNLEAIIKIRWCKPASMLLEIGTLSMGLLIRVILCMLLIAVADFIYQKWNHAKELRMTKQEVKEERKQYESSPEIKGKIRQMQMQMARKRMLADVPTADVVVCNPTHYAVALKYDQQKNPVPIVVAKGPDALALKIKEVARENGVPVLERPSLARALYAAVEIGHPVPNELFVAVAEVLAMIIRTRQKRKAAGFDLTKKPKKLNSK